MAPTVEALGRRPAARGEHLAVAVFGPTSAGKTRLSIALALRVRRELGHECVVVSADSRQVYRHMDIGTSKTTREEMRGVRHEMIGVAEPSRKLELEEYLSLARRHVLDALDSRRVPLVVGGTGTYVAGLVGCWRAEGSAAALSALRRTLPPGSGDAAHRLLRQVDGKLAARIHPHNREAAINALARAMSQAVSQAVSQGVSQAMSVGSTPVDRPPTIHWLVLGLDASSEVLDARIAGTFDRQLAQGLLDEIQSLNARYGLEQQLGRQGTQSPNQVLHTHGYREFFEYGLRQRKALASFSARDLTIVRDHVLTHIRSYARRQRTWLRKLPEVHRVRSTSESLAIVRRELMPLRSL